MTPEKKNACPVRTRFVRLPAVRRRDRLASPARQQD